MGILTYISLLDEIQEEIGIDNSTLQKLQNVPIKQIIEEKNKDQFIFSQVGEDDLINSDDFSQYSSNSFNYQIPSASHKSESHGSSSNNIDQLQHIKKLRRSKKFIANIGEMVQISAYLIN